MINEKSNPPAMLGENGIVGNGEDKRKTSCGILRMVSQAKLNTGAGPKWTIKAYHTLDGNANITSFSFPNIGKKVLYGKVREDVREILNTLCKYKNVEIIAGAVCVDHVHLSVAIPPKLSVSDFMGYLKGKSTLMLYDRHSELQSKWDKAFWARGYYVETIGNITDEAVQKYIKEQAEESRKRLTRWKAIAKSSRRILSMTAFFWLIHMTRRWWREFLT